MGGVQGQVYTKNVEGPHYICTRTVTHCNRVVINDTYLFSSHHADRLTSEQMVDEFGNERTKDRKNEQIYQLWQLSHTERSINVSLCIVLCELDAELCEIFPCGGEIVPDDWHILFNVHYNGCHVRTLVTNVLHTLPRHLKGGGGREK